mmetsp:Transcript_10315/g.24378  ORF Transcript_10315/g.24378 Transcript_10315/m.24378 type:complete len:201 (+) Transcript_10315:703-1305(+)
MPFRRCDVAYARLRREPPAQDRPSPSRRVPRARRQGRMRLRQRFARGSRLGGKLLQFARHGLLLGPQSFRRSSARTEPTRIRGILEHGERAPEGVSEGGAGKSVGRAGVDPGEHARAADGAVQHARTECSASQPPVFSPPPLQGAWRPRAAARAAAAAQRRRRNRAREDRAWGTGDQRAGGREGRKRRRDCARRGGGCGG